MKRKGGKKIQKTLNIAQKNINKVIIFLLLLTCIILFPSTKKCAISQNEIITIEDVTKNWKNISDKELNKAISNSDEYILSEFLKSLNQEELNTILEKDTMLKNDINIYVATNPEDETSEQIIQETKKYYEYLLELESPIMTLDTLDFCTKNGFFFIEISGDEKVTKRRLI